MLFQYPSLLWGMLAVAVPIALHFWHQQQAQPMPWVMLRWLETPNQPPKRGFRFDNLLLLLLRCLLLIALALLLARPFLKPDNQVLVGPKIHLVEPSQAVVEAHRFELEQALTKQERLMWATTPLTPLTTLTDLPNQPPINSLQWQTAINELAEPTVQLHTYLTNSPAWAMAPRLHVPAGFVLHAIERPLQKTPRRAIALPANKRLTIGPDNRLAVVAAGSASNETAATAPLRVLLAFRNADERTTVRAALNALTTVYGLDFTVDNEPVAGVTYAWELTDRPVSDPKPGTLYTLTGQSGNSDRANVGYVPESLRPETSELVTSGQLPEWLATQLLTYLGVADEAVSLPQRQLASLFVTDQTAEANNAATHPVHWLQTGLLLVFLMLLLTERWLASQRQA
ncbi:BatA domain-containing protein [Fibrella aquatica]|uniref:BatA domain-containing protein n=1 Tax=Fibrella aquatica TaxID=3242487 RepID=UPI0035214210